MDRSQELITLVSIFLLFWMITSERRIFCLHKFLNFKIYFHVIFKLKLKCFEQNIFWTVRISSIVMQLNTNTFWPIQNKYLENLNLEPPIMTVFKLTVLSSSLYIIVHLFVKHSVHGLSLLLETCHFHGSCACMHGRTFAAQNREWLRSLNKSRPNPNRLGHEEVIASKTFFL